MAIGDLDGVFDGRLEARTEGTSECAVDGAFETRLDGTAGVDGISDSAPSGDLDGISDGRLAASSDGWGEGPFDGGFEATPKGISDPALTGEDDGIWKERFNEEVEVVVEGCDDGVRYSRRDDATGDTDKVGLRGVEPFPSGLVVGIQSNVVEDTSNVGYIVCSILIGSLVGRNRGCGVREDGTEVGDVGQVEATSRAEGPPVEDLTSAGTSSIGNAVVGASVSTRLGCREGDRVSSDPMVS